MDSQWQYVLLIEERLTSAVNATPPPTFDEIEGLIKQMRGACENVIFSDPLFAAEKHCENHLWMCHLTINKRFRRLVEVYQKGDQKKHVERRKVEKRYADFIKTSQFFYKSFIQRLASQYPGNFGLRRIASRLQLDILSVEETVPHESALDAKLHQSCYNTLLRLGDLSRYRNQLRTKDRSWDTALGYYQLAQNLIPEMGVAHNQLAVIAINNDDHLGAVYHIYRAFTAVEPVKEQENNLIVEFNKIISTSEKAKHSRHVKTDSLTTLVNWFTLLHAKFYQGVDFATQKELENEVLTRLSSLLKNQTCEMGEVLDKFVMINIASEFLAAKKAFGGDSKKSEQALRTFTFTLAFNIRFFTMLGQVLLPELSEIDVGEDIPNSAGEKQTDRITVTCRRILPALRQYSIWLTTRAKMITGYYLHVHAGKPLVVREQVVEMWKVHGLALTRLVEYFNGSILQSSPYLLDEDGATVGFAPFCSPDIPTELKMFHDDAGRQKPRPTDSGIKRNLPNQEMQSRVFDIIIMGYTLQSRNDYPLVWNTTIERFVFDEAVLSRMAAASPSFSASSARDPVPTPTISEPSRVGGGQSAHVNGRRSPESSYSSHSTSMEAQMNAMVQDLVDAKFEQRDVNHQHKRVASGGHNSTYGMDTNIAQEVFGNHGNHSSWHITPKQLPPIPGIDGTFAPMPFELSPTSVGRQFSPDHASQSRYSTAEGRLAAAKDLERMTGYAQHPSWNPSNTPVNPDHIAPGRYYSDFNTNTLTNFDTSSINLSTPIHPNAHVATNTSAAFHRNDSTIYPGATNFDSETMLRSSPWANGRPGFGTPYTQTPPAGQAWKNG